MRKTERLIFEVTKRKCKFFRPPYGELDIRLLIYALKNKITIVNWSFDSTDSCKRSPIDLKQYLKSAVIKAGEIILFHEDYKHTQEALSYIITDLKSRGFMFSTVREFLE